jgi:hypothetical protein
VLGEGLALDEGLALREELADGLGVGLAGGELEAIPAGWNVAGAGDDSVDEAGGAGLETADAVDAGGDPTALSALWLLVQPVATRPMITTAPSSAVRLDGVSRWIAATGSG